MTPPTPPDPSWLDEPCPAWCVVEHEENDLPADRVHDSAGRYVPAVLGTAAASAEESAEILVLMSRACGDVRDWVFVGDPDRTGRNLSLSRESAHRLALELLRLTSGDESGGAAPDQLPG